MTQPLDYASRTVMMPAQTSLWGKGFLAVAGTLLLTGLGHLLAGRVRRAAGWMSGALLVTAALVTAMVRPALQPALFVLVPLGAIFSITCLVDAFLCGRRSARVMLYNPGFRYLAGLALIGASVLGNPVGRLARLGLTPLVEAYHMPTQSMSPTIKPGDHFLVVKARWTIRRWDLVVFHPPMTFNGEDKETWVKRVVGLPGERIEIVDGVVQVNGQPVSPPEPIRPYLVPEHFPSNEMNGGEGNPIFLKEGEYFVLGDNSPVSGDSRLWTDGAPGHQPGALPADHIVGRVTALYWPLSRCRRFQ